MATQDFYERKSVTSDGHLVKGKPGNWAIAYYVSENDQCFSNLDSTLHAEINPNISFADAKKALKQAAKRRKGLRDNEKINIMILQDILDSGQRTGSKEVEDYRSRLSGFRL